MAEAERADVAEVDPHADGVLNKDDVAKVARLALLDLTDDELDLFTPQLGAVLDRAQELQTFDVAGVAPTAQPYPLVNVFRADEPEVLSDEQRAEALAAAPESEDDLYKVPPALGEAP